jgi:N-acyl-D-amino-acid deacylase
MSLEHALFPSVLNNDEAHFDPLLVQDVSTFERPLAYPKGIDYVLVNGRVAVNAGQVTGLQSEKVLRHAP